MTRSWSDRGRECTDDRFPTAWDQPMPPAIPSRRKRGRVRGGWGARCIRRGGARHSSPLLSVLAVLLPGHAQAQDRGAAIGTPRLAALASGNYDRIRQGVDQLVTSGDPRAADVLGALQAGNLYVGPGQALFIKTETGFVAADTGAPAPDVAATALKPVRLNNPVRNAIAAALGGLRLFSPDPALRLEAAEAVFQSHDPEFAAGARPGLGEGRPTRRSRSGCNRRARRPLLSAPGCLAPKTGSRQSRCCANAAISPPAACSQACAAETQPEAVGDGRPRRRRRDRQPAAALEHRAESLLRAQPRLGAAAGGSRSGDHVRRHGRHQHGAWRDGHDRRLCDLRRAAGDAVLPARILWRPICLSRCRRRFSSPV